MNHTKGEWTSTLFEVKLGDYTIADCCTNNRPPNIRMVEVEANAHLIAAAVNACQSVNQDNPMAVAESIKDMYELLKELYEHHKYNDVGYAVSLIGQKIETTLAKAEGKC